ncbi:MAG: 1-aminocyclopropane-1-carboxylate deaminase/D-cysteine desulfhydrase [Flavitalea sp.]
MSLLPNNIIQIENAIVQKLNHPDLINTGISMDIIRFDRIHPVISGNKYFKLKVSLDKALQHKKKGILTFGGAWSNHLLATAAACRELGLRSIGIIRGERPANPSESLLDLESMGMKLIFISREEFKRRQFEVIQSYFPEYIVVPEGGAHEEGVIGAAEMVKYIPQQDYDLICCAIGTATMMSGIVQQAKIPVLGFSSLKLPDTETNTITQTIESYAPGADYSICYDYHFGGFGKTTPSLFSFMNELYHHTKIPTDIVYTGKMIYGLFDMARNKKIQEGSRIIILHSGGLQGNRSVKNGALDF